MLAVRLYDKQKMAPARLTTRSAVCCQASGGCLRVRFCGAQGLPTPGRKGAQKPAKIYRRWRPFALSDAGESEEAGTNRDRKCLM